jgi:hypothetical protein
MNDTPDNFDRRRFLKVAIGDILKTQGLPDAFAQTNYPKRKGLDDGSSGQPIINL